MAYLVISYKLSQAKFLISSYFLIFFKNADSKVCWHFFYLNLNESKLKFLFKISHQVFNLNSFLFHCITVTNSYCTVFF